MKMTYTVCNGAKIGRKNLANMRGREFDRWNFATQGKGWAVINGYFMVAGIGAWKRIY
jgi:hypothetical protein